MKRFHIALLLLSLASSLIFADINKHVPKILISDLEQEVEQARQRLEAAKNGYLKQVEQADIEYQWDLQSRKQRNEEATRKQNEQLADLEYQWELENQRLRAAKLYIEAGKSRALGLEQEAARQAYIKSNERIAQVKAYQYIKYDHSQERLNRQEGEGTDNPPRQIPYPNKKVQVAPVSEEKQIQSYLQHGTTRNESLKNKLKEEEKAKKKRLDRAQDQAIKRIDKTISDAKKAQAYRDYGKSRTSYENKKTAIKQVSKEKQIQSYLQYGTTRNESLKNKLKEEEKAKKKRLDRAQDQAIKRIDKTISDAKKAKAYRDYAKSRTSYYNRIEKDPAQVLKEIKPVTDQAARKKQIQSYLQYGTTRNEFLKDELKEEKAEKERLDLLQDQAMKRIDKTMSDAKNIKAYRDYGKSRAYYNQIKRDESPRPESISKRTERLKRQEGEDETPLIRHALKEPIPVPVLDEAARKKQTQSYLQYGKSRNDYLRSRKEKEKERLDLLQDQAMKRIDKTMSDAKNIKAYRDYGESRSKSNNEKVDKPTPVEKSTTRKELPLLNPQSETDRLYNSLYKEHLRKNDYMVASPGFDEKKEEEKEEKSDENDNHSTKKLILDKQEHAALARINNTISEAKTMKQIEQTINEKSNVTAAVKASKEKLPELSDQLIKPYADFDVLPNKKNAKQIRISATDDTNINVRIIGERGSMYKVLIYDGDTPREGSYFISKKWAERSLDMEGVVKISQLNTIVDRVGQPPVGDCITSVTPLPKRRPAKAAPLPRARPQYEEKEEAETEDSLKYREECRMPGASDRWAKNCEKLFRKEKVPADALKYALNVMKLNATSFRSNKCYRMKHPDHYSMNGLTKDKFEDKMRNGLKNKCQFVINNTKEKLAGCRGQMYYIDLCGTFGPKVKKDYFNMGTGTCVEGKGYLNETDEHTTVLGAFFTSDETFDLADRGADYNQTRSDVKKYGGGYKAIGLQLFGLQKTNNRASEDYKYMHVSPYQSSWGCPSIAAKNYYMINKLKDNGPSLVLNYGDNMEDINLCSK